MGLLAWFKKAFEGNEGYGSNRAVNAIRAGNREEIEKRVYKELGIHPKHETAEEAQKRQRREYNDSVRRFVNGGSLIFPHGTELPPYCEDGKLVKVFCDGKGGTYIEKTGRTSVVCGDQMLTNMYLRYGRLWEIAGCLYHDQRLSPADMDKSHRAANGKLPGPGTPMRMRY